LRCLHSVCAPNPGRGKGAVLDWRCVLQDGPSTAGRTAGDRVWGRDRFRGGGGMVRELASNECAPADPHLLRLQSSTTGSDEGPKCSQILNKLAEAFLWRRGGGVGVDVGRSLISEDR